MQLAVNSRAIMIAILQGRTPKSLLIEALLY
jgi:hypothetical protein